MTYISRKCTVEKGLRYKKKELKYKVTFKCLVDCEVEPYIWRNSPESGGDAAIQTPTPESSLLLQDGTECVADIPGW